MSRLVYSTDKGRLCPSCHHAAAQCQCRQQIAQGDGNIRISYETKGRNGRGVTCITGIPLASDELKQLLKQLKQRTSTGGTMKHGQLQLQGDQRQLIKQLLPSYDWFIKVVGES